MNTDVDQDLKIGVVGAGSWGTALANLLGCKGYPLDLWVFEPDVCRQIAKQHENKVYLPGITLSPLTTGSPSTRPERGAFILSSPSAGISTP